MGSTLESTRHGMGNKTSYEEGKKEETRDMKGARGIYVHCPSLGCIQSLGDLFCSFLMQITSTEIVYCHDDIVFMYINIYRKPLIL
jgi:hypothetical protein